MRGIGWQCALCLLILMGSPNASADAHSAGTNGVRTADEQTLIAIKEALVSEAQTVESQVVNTAWLDTDGKLHESTIVQSGMRVRGIQVQAYLDAMNQPKVEIALDDKSASLPQCFAQDDHLTRTVRIQPLRSIGVFEVDRAALRQSSGRLMLAQFDAFFEQSAHWRTKSATTSLDQYTATVTGVRNEPTQFELAVTLADGEPPVGHTPEPLVGSDPLSRFFNGSPSQFPEDWIRLRAQLIRVDSQTVVWTGTADFRVPVRDVGYSQATPPQVLARNINEQVSMWSNELELFGRCEPMQFRLSNAGTSFRLHGGAASGLEAGDRLLVLNSSKIPRRIFEPGTLAELSLIEVVSVETDEAEVEYRAGAPIQVTADTVALPF